jgi:NADH-quinone oxidoreductase subunit C
MADEKTTDVEVKATAGGPAPEGVTEGDDTSAGGDETTTTAITAPQVHPVEEIDADSASGSAERVLAEAADGPEHPVLAQLADAFDEGVVWSVSHGQDVATVDREVYLDFAKGAKEAGFEVCVDVTVVDWYRNRRIRFDLVVNILSQQHVCRLRIIVPVPGDDPTVASLVPVWPGANFPEREAYDMFGIEFDGHPDLTRILMPDDWEGHPLRKDFHVGAVPVQFKESHKVT